MWTRGLAAAALFCLGCSGRAPAVASEPASDSSPAPTEPSVEPAAAAPVDAPAEPPPETSAEPAPDEVADPASPRPRPPPLPTCVELERGQCVVTEGCEWHTERKCLAQEKPRTLEP